VLDAGSLASSTNPGIGEPGSASTRSERVSEPVVGQHLESDAARDPLADMANLWRGIRHRYSTCTSPRIFPVVASHTYPPGRCRCELAINGDPAWLPARVRAKHLPVCPPLLSARVLRVWRWLGAPLSPAAEHERINMPTIVAEAVTERLAQLHHHLEYHHPPELQVPRSDVVRAGSSKPRSA
jgi:hypothetical protein